MGNSVESRFVGIKYVVRRRGRGRRRIRWVSTSGFAVIRVEVDIDRRTSV